MDLNERFLRERIQFLFYSLSVVVLTEDNIDNSKLITILKLLWHFEEGTCIEFKIIIHIRLEYQEYKWLIINRNRLTIMRVYFVRVLLFVFHCVIRNSLHLNYLKLN